MSVTKVRVVRHFYCRWVISFLRKLLPTVSCLPVSTWLASHWHCSWSPIKKKNLCGWIVISANGFRLAYYPVWKADSVCVCACKVRSINCERPNWNSLTHRVKPWRSEECVCCWECWCWWTVLFRSASRGENQWKKVEHQYMNYLCNFSLTKFVKVSFILWWHAHYFPLKLVVLLLLVNFSDLCC